MKVIDCKEISSYYKKEYKDRIIKAYKNPQFYVFQFGNNEASNRYIRGKQKDCEECGINFNLIKLSTEIQYVDIIKIIKKISMSFDTCGIMVQLPLSGKVSYHKEEIINSIPDELDVDGMKGNGFLSCTPMGIILLLEYLNYNLDGKNCVVIGRSDIVGKPLAKALLNKNATVTVCHSHTKNIEEFTKKADVIFCAVGKRKFLNSSMVSDGTLIIDIGINFDENGKMCGDVDVDSLKDRDVTITPVPSGVGLMTRVGLLHNICENICEKL